jgi:hypothetical protein
VEEYDPEMMDEIRARIREGRWEVTASSWVENDKNMPDTESLLRHIHLTHDYLQSVWGVPKEKLNIDFSPDTFGHSAFIPEIDTFGGVRYMYHCRGVTTEDVIYRWQCANGKEILVCREPYWYNSGITPDAGTGVIELSHHSGGLKTGLIVYGVGNHGGGVTRRDIERILEMQEWPVFPKMSFGTFGEYFRRAESVREQLHVRTGELNAISQRMKLSMDPRVAAWDAEGMLEIVANHITATCCAVSPDAVYVAVKMVPDMEALRAEMARTMQEEFIPDLIYVDDYRERIFLGELALCLQKLKSPRPHRKV